MAVLSAALLLPGSGRRQPNDAGDGPGLGLRRGLQCLADSGYRSVVAIHQASSDLSTETLAINAGKRLSIWATV